MYRREKRVLLRHYLEQGKPKSELARRLGISRLTIYHSIEPGQLDRDLDIDDVHYSARPPVSRKIDQYTGIIATRPEEFPELTAQRLFEEIRASGYSGGYAQVKEYVHQVRPRPPIEPVIRFETPAGYQGQGGLRYVYAPLGPATRAPDRSGLLAPAVAAVLYPAGLHTRRPKTTCLLNNTGPL